jgi:hypothetical protein
MSRKLIALNVVIALVAGALAVLLVRDLASGRTSPPQVPAVARPATSEPGPPSSAPRRAAGDSPASYGVVASRNLFSPTRAESPPATPASAPVAREGPKPFLHGVILDDVKSRAFLEDPATKRTYGYSVGDAVGGGRLQRIGADRVVIARPEGSVEILLRDPAKPRPAPPQATAPTAGRGQAPRAPGQPPGGPGASPGAAPPAPVAPGPVGGPVPTTQAPGAPGQTSGQPPIVQPPIVQPPGGPTPAVEGVPDAAQQPATGQFLRRPAVATPPGQPDED